MKLYTQCNEAPLAIGIRKNRQHRGLERMKQPIPILTFPHNFCSFNNWAPTNNTPY